MQQTANYQTAAGAVHQMAPVTVFTFVVLAIAAVVAIAVIVVGARLAHKRRRGEQVSIEHQRDAAETNLTIVPPAPAAPRTAEPAVEPATVPVEPAGVQPQPDTVPGTSDLTRLKGLGPRVAARLGELGVYSIRDMARLTPEAARTLDAELTPFQGRLSRDRWVEQAQLLVAGDTEGFEREFGKLG